MKNCKIQNYESPNKDSIFSKDKLNCVYLDRELTFRFSSVKETKKFLAFLRSEIDALITSANIALVELYGYSRKAWYYSNENLFNEFADIEKTLNKIVKYQNSPSANFFIIQGLKNLFNGLEEIIIYLLPIFRKQNFHVDARQLENIKKRLLNEFNNLYNTLLEKRF
jgi:hypothetical protein